VPGGKLTQRTSCLEHCKPPSNLDEDKHQLQAAWATACYYRMHQLHKLCVQAAACACWLQHLSHTAPAALQQLSCADATCDASSPKHQGHPPHAVSPTSSTVCLPATHVKPYELLDGVLVIRHALVACNSTSPYLQLVQAVHAPQCQSQPTTHVLR
jgi:hypothetical protein